MATTIKFKKATAADWTSNNPVLASGEPGIETDTSKMKIGNGTQAWDVLTYVNEVPYNPTFSPTLERTLTPTLPSDGGFGLSDTGPDMGVSLNGSSVIIGEKESFIENRFKIHTVGTGTLERTITGPGGGVNYFGYGSSASGQYLVASGRSGTTGNITGHLYIYDTTTGSVVKTLSQSVPSAGYNGNNTDIFWRMAMNNNYILGTNQRHVVSGVDGGGAVYVYKTTSGDWTDTSYQSLILNPGQGSSTSAGGFGYAGDVSSNGYSAISATGNDAGVTRGGQVFIHDLSNAALKATIQSPTPSNYANFGKDVAFIGTDLLAVGEPGEDTGGGNSGAVHIFKTTLGDWTDTAFVASIESPSGAPADDQFGDAVEYSNGYLAVSAVSTGTGGPVFILSSASGDWDDATSVFEATNTIDPTDGYKPSAISIDADHMAVGRGSSTSPYNKGRVDIYKLIN